VKPIKATILGTHGPSNTKQTEIRPRRHRQVTISLTGPHLWPLGPPDGTPQRRVISARSVGLASDGLSVASDLGGLARC
jgi:hypothetical protein